MTAKRALLQPCNCGRTVLITLVLANEEEYFCAMQLRQVRGFVTLNRGGFTRKKSIAQQNKAYVYRSIGFFVPFSEKRQYEISQRSRYKKRAVFFVASQVICSKKIIFSKRPSAAALYEAGKQA